MVRCGMRVVYAAVALLVLQVQAPVPQRQVAITIDDVPRGGDGGSLALADVHRMTERPMWSSYSPPSIAHPGDVR